MRLTRLFLYLLTAILPMNCVYGQGTITTVAGDGVTQYIGDGWPATNFSLAAPNGLCTDKNGNIIIADYMNSRVRKLDMHDSLFTIAGTGIPGHSGDGGAATAAMFGNPTGVAIDTAGNIYVTEEFSNAVRRITKTTGIVTTVCGTGTAGYAGDGGLATDALLNQPAGLCLDKAGNIYIADKDNHRVRRIDVATGMITTFAGNGTSGYSGDGGAADNTKLFNPKSVASDTSGNIYIADYNNHRVRRVDAVTGIISTVAGTGYLGYIGDNGLAVNARLTQPTGVHVSRRGNVYIADNGNNVVRVITPDGMMHTIAGSGSVGYTGDGGPALSATFQGPTAACTDYQEYVYIADGANSAIRKVTPVYTAVRGIQRVSNLNIYPDPATDVINVSGYTGSDDLCVNILNSMGRMVYSKQGFAGEAIDVSGLCNGVYFLAYSDGNGCGVRKFVVMR